MPRRKIRLLAPDRLVEAGLDDIRSEMSIPEGFSPVVMDELGSLEPRFPDLDLTDIPLITVDPPAAQDLDQAFHLEQVRGGYRVNYAIADVAAFVNPGAAIDLEAHSRGQTFYGPDARTPLYPTELSEGRASLRADQTRPALVWRIDLDRHGEMVDGQIQRGMVRSRAQFAYQDIQDQLESGSGSPSVRLLPEIGRLRQIIEVERGAVSLNIPEQEVFRRDGGWDLDYRTPLAVEGWNAQLSLLTGFFAAKLMVGAGVGILRTLPPADPARTNRLRRVAKGLHIAWPDDLPYPDLIRSLDPDLASHCAFLAEAAGLFAGAGYQALARDDIPEPHAALAAVYAHTTAPLRRLVDRYSGEVCLAIVEGREPPDWVSESLPGLPKIMARSSTRAGQYEAASVNLVEAALLTGRVGEVFSGVVVELDESRASGEVQLREPAILAKVDGDGLDLGEEIVVKVAEASVPARRVRFDQT